MSQHISGGLLTYNQFKAQQASLGINIVGGDGSYNRYAQGYMKEMNLTEPLGGGSGGGENDFGQRSNTASLLNNERDGIDLTRGGMWSEWDVPDFATFVRYGNQNKVAGTGQSLGKISEMSKAEQVGMYNAFRARSDAIQKTGRYGQWKGLMKSYNFNAPGEGGFGGGGGGTRPPGISPTGGKKTPERDDITPPATGLEGTIKTRPSTERRRRSYLTG